MFDVSFQGFASGDVYEDITSIKIFLEEGVDQLAICTSFSKSMTLFSERVGCLHILAKNAQTAAWLTATLRDKHFKAFNLPPAHGA
jgi:aspartate aminotransferase